jgi:hypothetical protein
MIPEIEESVIIEYKVDSYGEISIPYEFTCYGVIDRADVFMNSSGMTTLLGKGTFFTSTNLTILPTMGIKIDTVEYKIKKLEKLYVDGAFHHYEVVYG